MPADDNQPALPPSPDRPHAANDPLGCLFDCFAYALLAVAALCGWVWLRAGQNDLTVVALENATPRQVQAWAIGLGLSCLIGALVVRFGGLWLYRKMQDD